MDLILASTSPIRQSLLRNAGVAFRASDPGLDEASVKAVHDGTDAELAAALADAKAQAGGLPAPGSLTIGSDSLVSVAGRRFSKPTSVGEAADHLRFFSGRTMQLTSAAALATGGEVVWRHVAKAELQVRALSDSFIEAYLQAEWPKVAYCVGVFQLEGRGVQLFETIKGDNFTILGLPLLPLLGELRRRAVLPS